MTPNPASVPVYNPFPSDFSQIGALNFDEQTAPGLASNALGFGFAGGPTISLPLGMQPGQAEAGVNGGVALVPVSYPYTVPPAVASGASNAAAIAAGQAGETVAAPPVLTPAPALSVNWTTIATWAALIIGVFLLFSGGKHRR